MRVKFVIPEYSGRIGTFKRGEEAEVPDAVGQKLVAARIAHSVAEPPAPKVSITTEAFMPPETTSLESPQPKRGPGRPRKNKG